MSTLALTCPSWTVALPDELPAHPVTELPGRTELAPVLDGVTRVVVAGTDGDLAAVVLRLLRTERLAEVAVAYLPSDPESSVARLWELPTDPAAAIVLARDGEARPVPLVRDDAGGVLLGRGELRPLHGVVYCDEHLLLRGPARRLVVTPKAPVGVDVRAHGIGPLRRTRAATGRAVQVGCQPTTAVSDGVPHPRPVERWTWYRHTEDLRLVR